MMSDDMTLSRPGLPPYRSALIDHPSVGALIPLFVFRMTDYVRQLEALLHAGDGPGLQRLAHQLKGAGESYGFAPITESATQIEGALRANKPVTEIAPAVLSLVAYMRGVEGFRR